MSSAKLLSNLLYPWVLCSHVKNFAFLFVELPDNSLPISLPVFSVEVLLNSSTSVWLLSALPSCVSSASLPKVSTPRLLHNRLISLSSFQFTSLSIYLACTKSISLRMLWETAKSLTKASINHTCCSPLVHRNPSSKRKKILSERHLHWLPTTNREFSTDNIWKSTWGHLLGKTAGYSKPTCLPSPFLLLVALGISPSRTFCLKGILVSKSQLSNRRQGRGGDKGIVAHCNYPVQLLEVTPQVLYSASLGNYLINNQQVELSNCSPVISAFKVSNYL